jgi:hypothetical protein
MLAHAMHGNADMWCLRTTALGLLLAACSGSVPRPLATSQPASAFRPVPYPPPAAFVELVSEPPDGDAVWVDGSWTFRAKRYIWQRGGWVKPEAGARYATWSLAFRDDGTIWFAPATWLDDQGRAIAAPEIVVPAETPPNELTSEELQSGQK